MMYYIVIFLGVKIKQKINMEVLWRWLKIMNRKEETQPAPTIGKSNKKLLKEMFDCSGAGWIYPRRR